LPKTVQHPILSACDSKYFNHGVQSIYATNQININLLKELIINLDTMRTYLLSSL